MYFQTHDRSPCGKQRDPLFYEIFLPKNLKVNVSLSVPRCITVQKELQAACRGHSLHFSDTSPFLLCYPPRVWKVLVHLPLLVGTPQRHLSPLRAHLQTQKLWTQSGITLPPGPSPQWALQSHNPEHLWPLTVHIHLNSLTSDNARVKGRNTLSSANSKNITHLATVPRVAIWSKKTKEVIDNPSVHVC